MRRSLTILFVVCLLSFDPFFAEAKQKKKRKKKKNNEEIKIPTIPTIPTIPEATSSSEPTSAPKNSSPKKTPPPPPPPQVPSKPNLVVIAVDSLHPSTLGSYGNESMRKHTTNMDALASKGVLFSSAYAAAGSTPSRASFLTARHALRSGLISGSRFGLSFFSPAQPGGLEQNDMTLPKMLKEDSAYGAMGHFGTWHLGYGGSSGASLPLQHGYDYFFGTVMQPSLKSCDNGLGEQVLVAEDKYGNKLDENTPEARAAAAAASASPSTTIAGSSERELGHTFWAFWSMTSLLWQTMVIVTVVSWFVSLLSTKSCGLSLVIILLAMYVPFRLLDLISISDPSSCILIRNDRIVEQPIRMGTYTNRITTEAMHFLESQMICSRHRCMERESFAMTVSYPLAPSNSLNALFKNDYTSLGAHADAVAEVDHNIGILVRKINHLGLRSRTLVVLTGFSPDYFPSKVGNGPMSVPLIVSFEGHTQEGTTVDFPVDIMDIVPTFLQLAEIEPSLPLDGTSFWDSIHAHAPKAITDAAVEKAESRSLLHYCSDTPVGLSRGQYTMMLETGDGSSSCVGTHLSSPRMCDRATDPTCKRWMEVGPDMSDYLAKEASLMLDEWKPQQDYVAKGDRGVRKISEWPVWSEFPCCGEDCSCKRDVPPTKGQAPRAKPKSGPRPM